MTTKLYLATMETGRHFFQSVASTENDAKTAILRGWTEHRKSIGADFLDIRVYCRSGTVKDLEEYFGINVTAIEMNDCARDCESLGTY